PSVCFSLLTVPLLWALARRLFGVDRLGQIAGLVAALLAAISPLYVYFAQEARMYAQLTFLGALAGYALLRTKDEGRRRKGHSRHSSFHSSFVVGLSSAKWWLAFILASVAALYTHYFAAFLLLAYGVCVVLACIPGVIRPSRRGRAARQLAVFGSAALAIVILYLPWLPAMLTRYRVDRSFWQGALKLGEALRHVAVSFTAGAPETMLEADAVRLLPWFGIAFAIAVAALVWPDGGRTTEDGSGATEAGASRNGAGRRWSLIYLFACLLVPIIAILALASRTPKFNARYLMLVSPAYLLILAGGIGALWIADFGLRIGRRDTHHASRITSHVSRFTHHASRLLAVLLLLFLSFASIQSLRNWFTDPAFTKAQWRELVAAVRAQIAPGEAVVLVSGHAWPVWDYYAPDIARVRLPDIDILDVNAALGFDAGAALNAALAGKSGVWLVRWQDEAVDPVGFAPYFLDRAGREEPVAEQFWQLGLRHWRLRPDVTIQAEPRPAHADGANYDHKLALLGWDDPVDGQMAVYWRGINTMSRDYQVSLIVEDAAGREVGRWDGRPAGYAYPTTRWRPGQTLFGQYPVPLPADAPPGDYIVTLAVYDAATPSGLDIRDAADNPAGKRVRLGPIQLKAR
ncbi:MAG: glycosyltransferase family 39 protein, partial [Anaerolineae bacterium]|nr:glycosyltransferase family 39 protein [Anaerolineae bacterium]